MNSKCIALPLTNAELYLHEQWVEPELGKAWMATLLRETLWEQPEVFIYGRHYPTPRLVAWYSDPAVRYGYSGLDHPALAWTPLLQAIRTRVEHTCEQAFNGVLLNHYRTGQDSMGWHSDNEAVLGHNPVIASLSLGKTRRFDLRRKGAQRIEHSLLLTHGSLLIMRGTTQHYWQHQIAKTRKTLASRLNLTFRWIKM
ncbi:alkylated DNA repair dioxygenase AlkB [Pseudomonas duriflava]|uniref:Alkylated DNA repair dioxygenase AlkB n=1 Tax=Pseudomonas duriflava TaxID=459528 RepID=A0A562QBG2_9PSED|nr:alpha-ketoglutarate-dependent dioxygenase AlkB [Pseudomonas duriflava]TWI53520.1 alkylated DNA repair dioxygenase AlkB [Pseudomonas duriflava]